MKVFLVANKSDLDDKRQCSKEQGEQFASENSLDYFTEASAKYGINIQNVIIVNIYKHTLNCHVDLHSSGYYFI